MDKVARDQLRAQLAAASRRDAPEQKTAALLAEALGESSVRVVRLLARYVSYAGPEQALSLLDRTKEIEAADGMLVNDGSRRRTKGGVFFKLAKDALPKDVVNIVFPWTQRSSTPPQKALEPLAWKHRESVITALLADAASVGLVHRVTARLTVAVKQRTTLDELGGSVLFEGTVPAGRPGLPRGIPQPPEAKPVRVLCPARQAQRVPDLHKHKDDRLVAEGYPCLGADGGLLLLASTASSLNALKRKARP